MHIQSFVQVCGKGHVGHQWCSQPRLRARGVNLGDFMICTNIILSGNNFHKVALLLNFMNLGRIIPKMYYNIQKLYCCPVIEREWHNVLAATHDRLRDKNLVICGMYHVYISISNFVRVKWVDMILSNWKWILSLSIMWWVKVQQIQWVTMHSLGYATYVSSHWSRDCSLAQFCLLLVQTGGLIFNITASSVQFPST